MTYSEYPVWVLDQKDHVTRRRTIKFYKVQWDQHSEEDAQATTKSREYKEVELVSGDKSKLARIGPNLEPK